MEHVTFLKNARTVSFFKRAYKRHRIKMVGTVQ
jgi:hypothetical protein